MGEQKAKIEELIENTEELKTDCSNSKHKVKQLIESTRLKEDEIKLLNGELNIALPEVEKIKQLHRSSTSELDKAKTMIMGKEDKIVELIKNIEKMQQSLNSSERKNQQILTEMESERLESTRKKEEIT